MIGEKCNSCTFWAEGYLIDIAIFGYSRKDYWLRKKVFRHVYKTFTAIKQNTRPYIFASRLPRLQHKF